MKRTLYSSDHDAFRESVAAFVQREVVPNLERWEEDAIIDRGVWLAAGKQGLLGLAAPEAYGGAGGADYRFRNVILAEFAKVPATALASSFSLQDDIAIPSIPTIGNQEQKQRFLPPLTSGQGNGTLA